MHPDGPAISEQVFHILLSLMERPLHGYAVLQEVEHRTAGRITLGSGTLYSAIKRMLLAKWVKETPGRDADDPRRRSYRLTPLGREVVRAEARRLEELLRQARAKSVLANGDVR